MTRLYQSSRRNCKLLLVVSAVVLFIGASGWQLAASARPLDCVDHGCSSQNGCINLGCDVCASDSHCGLIP
jgi:hypothetical protein